MNMKNKNSYNVFEIWNNLKEGILLENKDVLIPWNSNFEFLNDYGTKDVREDRSTWYFKNINILNGIELNFETNKWKHLKNRKFEYISTIINNQTAEKIVNHLTENIGIPNYNNIDFKNLEDYDCRCEWTKFDRKIKIYRIELHGGFAFKIKIGVEKVVDEYI